MNFNMDFTGVQESSKVYDDMNKTQPLDSWSVIWYIASFGGLIAFFLVVSCSEWCCRRSVRNSSHCRRAPNSPSISIPVPDTPPPSYDEFAPPSYESIIYGSSRGEKSEFDVYVVPVHALGSIMEGSKRDEPPPSYHCASIMPNFSPACSPSTQTTTVLPQARRTDLPSTHQCSQPSYSVT